MHALSLYLVVIPTVSQLLNLTSALTDILCILIIKQAKEKSFSSEKLYAHIFQNLKELYMENNCLEYLPPEVGSLTHLKILDCHNNLLKELPESVCQIQGEK